MAPLLDLLRLFTGATLLAFASYTDWKWRRAPNVLWIILCAAGLCLLAADAVQDPAPWSGKWPYLLAIFPLALLLAPSGRADLLALVAGAAGLGVTLWRARAAPETMTAAWPYLAGIVVFAAAMYALWYFGLIAGGADAKALLALAILLPFPLSLAPGLPLSASPLPGAFVVLGNSLLAFLVIPLSFLAWNLAHGDARFPHLLVGVKRRAADVEQGHQWPMEIVDESGARTTRFMASRMSDEEIAATFERVQALGDERVWVSPKIPFMIPMLAGFLLAFSVGDLLLAFLSAVLPAR
ncbi:MAG TPA: A24 family peptidase C-terminal domain-containing protein [Candidatus Thermoplasmatota archaeon]|nr:A24 family peptidase C-terminal domain-containing protein [Candidatus Thermoplasmatota archaeon]